VDDQASEAKDLERWRLNLISIVIVVARCFLVIIVRSCSLRSSALLLLLLLVGEDVPVTAEMLQNSCPATLSLPRDVRTADTQRGHRSIHFFVTLKPTNSAARRTTAITFPF